MCGIAGYSLHPRSGIDRTLAAQALLAGIAERGADAAGYAARSSDGCLVVEKTRSRTSALVDRLQLTPASREALLHVRKSTKGHPAISTNNHPVRHAASWGSTTGRS